METFKELTRKELEEFWNTSGVTVSKKVKQNGLETFERNNRKYYRIAETLLNQIKKDIEENKKTFSSMENTAKRYQQNFDNITETFSEPLEAAYTVEKQEKENFEATKYLVQRLENVYEMLIKEKDNALLRLEDKASSGSKDLDYWKTEFFRLQQENELHKKELQTLKQELETLRKKWWTFGRK